MNERLAPACDLPGSFPALREALARRAPSDLRVQGFRDAAVLVPIFVEQRGPAQLILTLRHAALRAHAGQIAFPGGKRDEVDADAAATAVRETREEVGIEPARIEILGRLDGLATPSGYNITPVVGSVAGPLALSPASQEVAEAFCVSLPELRRHHRSVGTREFGGITYEAHEFVVGSRRIWGATARIIYQLLQVLDGLGAD